MKSDSLVVGAVPRPWRVADGYRALARAEEREESAAERLAEIVRACEGCAAPLDKALMKVGRILKEERGEENPFAEFKICPPLALVDLPVGDRWPQMLAGERIVRHLTLEPCSEELLEAREELAGEVDARMGLLHQLNEARMEVGASAVVAEERARELGPVKRWSDLKLLRSAVIGGWATTAGSAMVMLVAALANVSEAPIGAGGNAPAVAVHQGIGLELLLLLVAAVTAALTAVWLKKRAS